MSGTLSNKPEKRNKNENLWECPRPRGQEKYAKGGNGRSTDESSIDIATPSQDEDYGDRSRQSLEYG
jgi:hypothetical protein